MGTFGGREAVLLRNRPGLKNVVDVTGGLATVFLSDAVGSERILCNFKDFSTAAIDSIIRLVRPRGTPYFQTIIVPEPVGGRGFFGCAREKGKDLLNPVVLVYVGDKIKYPYEIKYPKVRQGYAYDDVELLVFLLAHEIRHVWQFDWRHDRGYRSSTSESSRSEVSANKYALRMLDRFKRLSGADEGLEP